MKNVLKTVVVVSLLAVLVGCPGNDAGLNPPEQFAAFGSSTTTITLAWSPVQNAIGYALERKSNSTAPFMPFARVDAQTTSLLDQNLTAGIDYLYRLQTFNNLGVSSSIEQHAITSADEALKTQNEMSVGQPIQKVIDSLGGTVSTADGQTLVRFPSGGVSEGTQITLQSFANPVQNNPYLGLEISSSASLSKPVIVSFQYGEQDALDAKNLVLVVQEADGSWVARPSTLDETARTISIKISDETQFPTGISTKTGPNRKTKILPLKSTWIEPKNPHVAVHKTVELMAYGLFSDYPCDVPGLGDQVFCTAIGLTIDLNEMVRPVLREVKKLSNNLKGWERDWTVELKIGGSAVVGTILKHSDYGAVYTAPEKVPSPNPVAVRFTSVKVSGNNRGAAIPTPAAITIEDLGYKVVADASIKNFSLCGGNAYADLSDHLEFTLKRTESGAFQFVDIVNQKSGGNDTIRLSASSLAINVIQSTPTDFFFMTKGEVQSVESFGDYSVVLFGTFTSGKCTVNYSKRPSETFPEDIKETGFGFSILPDQFDAGGVQVATFGYGDQLWTIHITRL